MTNFKSEFVDEPYTWTLYNFFAQKCPDVEFIDSIGELHLLSDFDAEIEDFLLFLPSPVSAVSREITPLLFYFF